MSKPTEPKRGGYSGGPVLDDPKRGFWLLFAVSVAAFVVAVTVWIAKQ